MFDINSTINRTLIYFPIFKIIINNIHFIENGNIKTACTNGDTIYYNPAFFEKLSKDEQVFTVAHEVMHITLKHLSRLEERDMEVWNYATDAVINQILKKNGLPLINGVIDCPDALSFSAEEYYEITKNRPDCEELMSRYRSNKHENKIATHEHWNKELEKDLTKDLSDINEQNITEINKKLIHDDNQDYKNSIEKQPSITTDIRSIGNSSPIIDWKKFLQRKKKKVVSSDYNLQNGFFDEDGIYKYPYELIRKANIEVLIDSSGSVDDELVKAFLQECKNIFDDSAIKVGCFDTEFYGFQEISKKEDLDSFVIEGRGGTNFSTAVNSFDNKAAIKIVFTDGYAEMPKDSSDVIWIVYGNDKINPPGGKVFFVDPDSLTLKGKSR